MNGTDTIAAISTPLMTGAVGIVRISGSGSAEILGKLFHAVSGRAPVEFEPAKLYFGTCDCGSFSDRCLAVLFRGPKSFTGEDMAEIQCHGGVEVVRGVLKAALSAGARMAEPGEFTRRAFLNGKQDLSSCEGVGDMIHAESKAELSAAGRLERGDLFRKITAMQDVLTDVISYTEVMLDYPEEDVPEQKRQDMIVQLETVRSELETLSESYDTGKKIKEGISAVLCGRTNAGKSSLFNALLRFDRAIVTDVAGTTRDTIEGCFEVGGVKIQLTDTAGVREGRDEVERMGIARSLVEIKNADLVVYVFDEKGLTEEDGEILRCAGDREILFVQNKADLDAVSAGGETCGLSAGAIRISEEAAQNSPLRAIRVSAKTGENLDELRSEIVRRTLKTGFSSGLMITNERHFEAISRAKRETEVLLAGFGEKPFDMLALDLKSLWDVLGEITGTTATEAIIDNIFKKFCLGK